jgi:multiple sugar transport system ATP-binding protein
VAEISLKGITKRYPDGTAAVNSVDLEIADGEFVILVGPSGCGKSTLLRMIVGLEDISEGEMRIGGEVVNGKAAKDRNLAMVFQNYALYPHLSVRENMAFPLRLAKVSDDEITSASRRPPRSSSSARTSTASRRTCPVASASASPWAAPSCATRRRSCSTSR